MSRLIIWLPYRLGSKWTGLFWEVVELSFRCECFLVVQLKGEKIGANRASRQRSKCRIRQIVLCVTSIALRMGAAGPVKARMDQVHPYCNKENGKKRK
jgi:hypothetical protein